MSLNFNSKSTCSWTQRSRQTWRAVKWCVGRWKWSSRSVQSRVIKVSERGSQWWYVRWHVISCLKPLIPMLYEWQHLNNKLCNDAMEILVKNYSFNHPIVVLWTFLLFMFFLLLTVVPKSHLILVYIFYFVSLGVGNCFHMVLNEAMCSFQNSPSGSRFVFNQII